MRGLGRVFRPRARGRETAVWWLDYSVRGQRHRESSGTTSKAEAHRLLRERIGNREAGKLVGRPERVAFRDLRAGLERHYDREGNRSKLRAQQALNHLERFFGAEARALEITRQRVTEYIEQRLEKGAARGTARYEVAILNAAFSVAVQNDVLAVRPSFKLPRAGDRREGFVEPGKFAALLLELPDHVRPVVQFLYVTGWRKSEALGLTWDEVDWETKTIRLSGTRTKSGEPRVFPFALAPELRHLLEARMLARNGVFVFHRGDGRRIGSFRRAWDSACRRAGVAGRLVHDLRRSAARDLVSAGVPQHVVMKLSGWETDAMFRRYAIVNEKVLAEAVGKRFNGKQTANNTTPTEPEGSLSSSPVISAA